MRYYMKSRVSLHLQTTHVSLMLPVMVYYKQTTVDNQNRLILLNGNVFAYSH